MDEGREHIKKMLDILNRQRQLLEEKIATFGVPVAPHDTIALDDTNAQIAMQQARRLREKTEGTQEAGGERIHVRGSAWICDACIEGYVLHRRGVQLNAPTMTAS